MHVCISNAGKTAEKRRRVIVHVLLLEMMMSPPPSSKSVNHLKRKIFITVTTIITMTFAE